MPVRIAAPFIHDDVLDDKPREECGICAVFSLDATNVGELLFFGLQALQHRGQESCGISVVKTSTDNKACMKTHKNMGLVSDVFTSDVLAGFTGSLGIGHVRYSTVGSSHISGAQPFHVEIDSGPLAVAHNGTISNAGVLRDFLEDVGEKFFSDTDSEVLVSLIRRKVKYGFPKAIARAASMLQGSYSMVFALGDKIIGIKDPYGIRPLCVGILGKNAYVLASESCALDAMGAQYIREIEGGEIIVIDKHGLHEHNFTARSQQFPCAFEQIYFSRPDSILSNTTVYHTREAMGRLLYEQTPLEADVVVGVPDSGVPAAVGFSAASRVPLGMGLVKNKYISRSFINPTQEMREKAVRAKFNVVADVVSGKRVVLVDDSLVRGTTSTIIIQMIRNAGAKEVHFRLASPPVRYLCHFGIDISKRQELAAHTMSIEKLGKSIGADSLVFLSIENLRKSLAIAPHCMGCFVGVYPTYAPAAQSQ